jgi:hypothetical protein
VFQKEKLVNSKTIRYTVLKRKLVQQELIWFRLIKRQRQIGTRTGTVEQHAFTQYV